MKQIKLTQKQFALVDNEDFEYLNQWRWYAHKIGNTFYAARRRKKIERNGLKVSPIFMHREILKLQDSQIETDHIDHDGLNNQKSNLRKATSKQNSANLRPYKNSVSRFKGVSWDSKLKKWRARILKNGKNLHLGYFKEEQEAALIYNVVAKETFGEFAYLNSLSAV